ncbi:hypothetical protein SmJEL517_g04493 [Synchytrium microbalum]|uniref:Nucleolus and neural progenitor protein-like N-terminal domain-containing protein n=1 Tax=Synchytrium microbalum TaxID=1806994 RepID=A0A507C039_9FUNG|nr:uncharacterized protein SmJEL517_g04493 [Synchytrium microbalum]TPX32429.1 hypothetical protein SmJEL517_g04493 [Synchytrium microbalum]
MLKWSDLLQARHPQIPHTSQFLPVSTTKSPLLPSPIPTLVLLVNALKGSQLESDLFLFSRTYYKNSSQHRSGLHWKKYQQVRRVLARFGEVNLKDLVQEIVVLMQPDKLRRKGGEYTSIPNYVGRIQDTLIECYNAFRALTRQTLFMATSVTMMGLTSRLHILFRHISLHIEQCYTALRPFLDFAHKTEIVVDNVPLYLSRVAANNEQFGLQVHDEQPSGQTAIEDADEQPSTSSTAPETTITESALSDSFFSVPTSMEMDKDAEQRITTPIIKKKSKKKAKKTEINEIDDIFG